MYEYAKVFPERAERVFPCTEWTPPRRQSFGKKRVGKSLVFISAGSGSTLLTVFTSFHDYQLRVCVLVSCAKASSKSFIIPPTTMRRLLLVLFVSWLCMLLQTVSSSEDGRCSGCRDQKHANDLFDHLAFAIKYHERLSYLALDMSWLERVMHEHGKVHISFHQFSKDNLETGHELLDDIHLKSLASFHDKSEHKDHKPVYYDADGCKLGSRCGAGNNATQTETTAARTEPVSSKGEQQQETNRRVIRVTAGRRN